jgi:hypothetical protein
MIKVLKQTAKLGIFWVAICSSVAGALFYTKSGLEIVFADAIAENQVSFVKPAAPTKLARSQ